jgi:hypothetical protein
MPLPTVKEFGDSFRKFTGTPDPGGLVAPSPAPGHYDPTSEAIIQRRLQHADEPVDEAGPPDFDAAVKRSMTDTRRPDPDIATQKSAIDVRQKAMEPDADGKGSAFNAGHNKPAPGRIGEKYKATE